MLVMMLALIDPIWKKKQRWTCIDTPPMFLTELQAPTSKVGGRTSVVQWEGTCSTLAHIRVYDYSTVYFGLGWCYGLFIP